MENHKLFQSNQKWRLYLTLGLALLFLVALLCGLQGVPMIQADPGTLHVDGAQGQDTPTCGTAIAPCQTIFYALDNRASGGDTIRVTQGVYTENLIVDKRVTLEGGYEPVGWTRNTTQYETIIDGSESQTVVGDWDGSGVHMSTVISDAGVYKMWYGPNDRQIGYASSSDGINWNRSASNPVLSPAVPGQWDESGLSEPNVLFDGALYRMWFTGWQYGWQNVQRGYATSTNGIMWTKYAGNPVLTHGWPGQESQPVVAFVGGSDGAMLDGFTVTGGDASWGGGILVQGRTITIQNCIIFSNTAEYGGGLAVAGPAMATITGCQFISNTATQNAGGLRVNGEVTIEDSVFQGNTAQGNGGAIQGQNLVMRRSRVLNNRARNGGGIDIYFGFVCLEDVDIIGNSAADEGGGFRVGDGEMTVVISNTRILTNTASNGGGIHLYDGSISLYNTLVRGNTATLGTGGGIRAAYFELRYSPELTLVNTLVVLNSAALPAGGIRLDRWPATLINTTVAHNNGGVLASPFPTQTVAFTNTILWDNGADDLQCSSGCTVAYSNLGEGVWPGTGNISKDPRFIDAANGDYHLYAASPCIDAGTLIGAPAHDIEGKPRNAAPDMGAYEWTGSRIFLPLIVGGSSAPSLFSVEVVGYGEHGAMIELFYDGQWSDLEEVTIRMRISQDGRTIETQDVKVLDGQHLAEMTDAMYQFGEIDVELALQEESGSARKIRMQAEFDQWYPFIHPVYAASDFTDPPLDIIETHGWEEGPEYEWYAKDFCLPCNGNEHNPGAGIPVYMPFSFQIGCVEQNNNHDDYENSYSIYLFHPYTGFIFFLCHLIPGPAVVDFLGDLGRDLPVLDDPYSDPYPYDTETIPYDPNAIVGFWAPSDHPNGPPHLHMEGQISFSLLGLEHPDLALHRGYLEGDWGNPRYNNCAAFGLENYGPCFTSDGQVAVTNISMERFLLNDWVDPSR